MEVDDDEIGQQCGSGRLREALAQQEIAIAVSDEQRNTGGGNAAQRSHDGRDERIGHLIVANPPYVPLSHRQTLSPDVRDHEPAQALYGLGDDGLDHARALLAQAPSRLTMNGVLLMEFGFSQAQAVRDALGQVSALEPIEILRDLQGHERTLVARRSA